MEQQQTPAVIDAPELQAVEPSKADQIRATFLPMAEGLKTFEAQFDEIVNEAEVEITGDLTKRAKRLRLDIAKVRSRTEKVRKEQKEQYLKAGRAIDGVGNILKWAISDKEARLKAIEDHFANLEKERLDKLQTERILAISEYIDDAHERDLSSMDDDVWNAFFSSKKQAYEDRVAAEKKAEEERIAREKAEAEERERIRKENERLKAEAEAARKQREKEEAERKAKEEAERQAREAEEAARRKKEEEERRKREEEERKLREKHEAKLRAERKERERIMAREEAKRAELERKLREKEEAERQAREEAEIVERERLAREEEERQVELNKGDADKLTDLANDIGAIIDKYNFKSKRNRAMFVGVCEHLNMAVELVVRK